MHGNRQLLDLESPTPSKIERLTKFLSPYKELIAILLFFAGGGVWVAGYFATKSQVKELRCFAREGITLARAEVTLRTTYEDLVQLGDKLAGLEKKKKDGTITDEEKTDLKRTSRDYSDLKEKRDLAKKKFEAAEAKLLDSECSMGELE